MKSTELFTLEPIPTLIVRLRAELPADFDFNKSIRISRAPGRLDVMGGIADYTGSLVCEATLDRAAAVALQTRADRQLQVFSFNLFDEHQPFTFRIPLDSLATHSADDLRKGFNQPGRRWAAYLAGCLFLLHENKLIDLHDKKIPGLNLALLSTVPLGGGVSSSAAVEVATMMNLIEHFQIRDRFDPMKLAAMCQSVENRIVGAPCGIMDQVTSCVGEQNTLLRLLCQPHELRAPLNLPEGLRFIGINSAVKHSVGGGMYGITRCAAFMGHKIILEKMRAMGSAAGKTLDGDPMNGYLANLDPDDYKKYFRPFLPQSMKGLTFLETYGPTIDKATVVNPTTDYHVLGATDHHVLEAMRVRNFVAFLEEATTKPRGTRDQGILLDKAGHLMYASHLSYTNDAKLGAPECDLLVDLVKKHEPAGLYGAKITGGGSGGTVAIMLDNGPRASNAIAEIVATYEKQASHKPDLFAGSSPGGWHVGTTLLR